jgi:hypothetical protein
VGKRVKSESNKENVWGKKKKGIGEGSKDKGLKMMKGEKDAG